MTGLGSVCAAHCFFYVIHRIDTHTGITGSCGDSHRLQTTVNIKMQLHNVNVWVKIFSIYKSIQ